MDKIVQIAPSKIEEEIRDIVAGIVHCDKSIITRESTFKDIKADCWT